jgi:hypothetical protein
MYIKAHRPVAGVRWAAPGTKEGEKAESWLQVRMRHTQGTVGPFIAYSIWGIYFKKIILYMKLELIYALTCSKCCYSQ